MKVALLTIWHEKNYGAELQAYATIKAIMLLGHTPEMINIHIANKGKPSLMGKVANFIEKLLPANMKFEKFWQRYIPVTKKYNSIDELYKIPPIADIYLVGSDQVWNPDITKDFWKMFFLDFGKPKKKISYASSFGVKQWNYPYYVEEIKKKLETFSVITCREDSGVKILHDTFGVESKSVLDPTLLFTSYEEFVLQPTCQGTLVYYPLSDDYELEKYCIELAKRLGLKPVNTNKKNMILDKIQWNRPSIELWVQNIANANFVVTRSFHGLAFCLIYQKQFAILKSRNDRGTRLDNLLTKLGIEDRAFSNIKEMDIIKPWEKSIDYSILMPKLNILREESWSIFKDMLDVK